MAISKFINPRAGIEPAREHQLSRRVDLTPATVKAEVPSARVCIGVLVCYFLRESGGRSRVVVRGRSCMCVVLRPSSCVKKREDCHRPWGAWLPPYITVCHPPRAATSRGQTRKPPQAATSRHKPPQAATSRHKPPRAATSRELCRRCADRYLRNIQNRGSALHFD